MQLLTLILELLAQHEVEVTASLLAINIVKAVAPVYSHHANHWQEDASSNTGRTRIVAGKAFYGPYGGI